MKAGKYNIKELFSNKNIEAVVVPEIQRDYVWGTDQVQGLLKSIFDDYSIFEKTNEQVNITIEEDRSLEKTLTEYYKTIKYNTSIGFIYAYSDFEYPDKYFLIDGQQRLTTIYLLLVVIASEDEDFRNKFSKLYFKNGKSFIEYRVREASLLFLNQSIAHTIEKKDTKLIEQYWYYNFYKNDKTIQSIIKNLKTIKDFLSENVHSLSSFKEYVLNHVQFWYFDTNISEQGEELYIYMNARGERMQSNENLKAELLANVVSQDDKDEWGIKWEEWQNNFWLIRGKHENSDDVFNEFVYCIAGLENQKNNLRIVKEVKDKKYELPKSQELLKCFKIDGLITIEKYVKSLDSIVSNKLINYCTEKGLYSDWILDYKKIILNFLNNDQTNWFSNVKDKNRNIERNRMVCVWSAFNVLNNYVGKPVDDNLIFSLRIFYNRYHNYVRSVQKNIIESILFSLEGYEKILEKNIKDEDDEANNEEYLKYSYISNLKDDIILKLSTIWQLEDHPTNLNGRDVGNLNSIHLIDYQSNLSLEHLQNIKQKFFELIPLDEKGKEVWDNYGKLLNCLITYGKCWNAKVTNDYDNLDFANERRIIRDVDADDNKSFSRFFNDYLKAINLADLESKILTEPIYNDQTEDWLEIIQWYNFKLREKMWTQGWFLAVGARNYRKNDKYFQKKLQFVNTKGNFQGGNPAILSSKIKKAKP